MSLMAMIELEWNSVSHYLGVDLMILINCVFILMAAIGWEF